MENRSFSPEEFTRLANNFYNSKGLVSDINRIALDAEFTNYFSANGGQLDKKYKVALCCICVNPPYWQYIKPMIEGAKQFFLPGHQTDVFLWTDLPDLKQKDLKLPDYFKIRELFDKGEKQTIDLTLQVNNPVNHPQLTAEIKESFRKLQEKPLDAIIFPIEPIEWPMPTLMRYHTMLQQEEKLAEYDYVAYIDVDMMFVNIVGDEILGKRLTAVQQPMYSVDKKFIPPYEPNSKSASYIPRPGKVVNDNGKPRFLPLYLAGGFQLGESKAFISAMKEMKKTIDKDLNNNYVPIWNDETVFNSYLFNNPSDDDIILTPSYCYPDSLIKEYFEAIWGYSYQPKLMTLTKKFSFQPGSGEQLQKTLNELKVLK